MSTLRGTRPIALEEALRYLPNKPAIKTARPAEGGRFGIAQYRLEDVVALLTTYGAVATADREATKGWALLVIDETGPMLIESACPGSLNAFWLGGTPVTVAPEPEH